MASGRTGPAGLRTVVRAAGRGPGEVDKATLLALRTGGPDVYSRLKLGDLWTRVSPPGGHAVAAALPDPRDQAAALRWILRGLPVDLAIRKQQAERALHPPRPQPPTPAPQAPRPHRCRARRAPVTAEGAQGPTGPEPIGSVGAPGATVPGSPRLRPLSRIAAGRLLQQPEFRTYFGQALAEALRGRDRQAMEGRYGVTTGRAVTLDAVGQQLGVSRARAGQLLTRGWRQISRQAARQQRAGLAPGPQAACAWLVNFLTASALPAAAS